MAPTTSPDQSSMAPIHLLSKKSQMLQRNTFFFIEPQGVLLAGLNQRITPITSAKLHRWAKLLDPYCSPFELIPVELTKFGILRYSRTPKQRPIPAESTMPLPPGDYSWNQGTNIIVPFGSLSGRNTTFADWTAAAATSPRSGQGNLNYFTSGLEDIVRARDGGLCFVTGTKENVEITWVCPPACCICTDDSQYIENPQVMQTPSNATLIAKELIVAFNENAFGIDVEDNYRIVVFREFGNARELLPEHAFIFQRTSAAGQGPRGDISEDYHFNDILHAMAELGVDPGGEGDAADFDHPQWRTPLGKEIFEDYMKNLIAAKEWASAESDEDDSA